MVDKTFPSGSSRSALVGLHVVASLPAGRLVGQIVGVSGDLAVIQALEESDILGPGLLLLRLSGVALPGGCCRLFRSREELARGLPARRGGTSRAASRRRAAPRLVASETRSADL